jgi:hypothetical protein
LKEILEKEGDVDYSEQLKESDKKDNCDMGKFFGSVENRNHGLEWSTIFNL